MPRVNIANALDIIKNFYIHRQKGNKYYTQKSLADALQVKYGTLKWWFWKKDQPTIEAWETFKKLPDAEKIIEKSGIELIPEVLAIIPESKLGICLCGCKREFVKFAHNKKYFSRQCKNKMRKSKRSL